MNEQQATNILTALVECWCDQYGQRIESIQITKKGEEDA